jgi:ParB/RepB/Spo0J family partition protein
VSANETPAPSSAILEIVKGFLGRATSTEEAPAKPEEEGPKEPGVPDLVSKARSILERRRHRTRRKMRKLNPVPDEPSDGEVMSELALLVRMIPVEKIFMDPDFDYARVHEDPIHPEWYGNEGQHLTDLEESMREEGMKDPIEVQEKNDEYMLRSGTRRWKIAKKLGWTHVPGVIIPANFPPEWSYWSAVMRNTTRKLLGTYEVALAAKIARDKYETAPTDFARKTGYSAGYVFNLLRCIDHLPDELIEQWKNGARVTLDQWITLSHLDHEDAIKLYRKWVGYTPVDRMRDANKNARRKPLPPPKWLDRMMRLYVGVEGSDLSPRERDNILHAIEHCMGTRDGIPNVYEPRKHKIFEKKAELRRQLKMPDLPDPGEEKEMPPPMDEVEDGSWKTFNRMVERDPGRKIDGK